MTAAAVTPTRTGWGARILPWALTLLLLAGAWVLNAVALPDTASRAPFVTAAQPGQTVTAGNLAVTVTDLRVARSITDPQGWTAEGTWLVAELDAAAVDSQYGSQLSTAELTIGDRTFRATERGETLFRSGALVTGVMRHGAVAFELPSDVTKKDAVLRLGNAFTTTAAGVVEVPVDLGAIPVEDSAALPKTEWADR